MLEFLFGVMVGVWMGQTIPLPSVHKYVMTIGARVEPSAPTNGDGSEQPEEEEVPLFTGNMPTPLTSV